jgi:phosphotransferase system enzyme I (PtsI)
MLPETRLDTAAVVAERINRNVAAIDPPKPEGEKPLSLTMSIGIAQFGTGDIRDGDTLISAADTMMYEAKKAGKNRVCLFRDARNEPVDDSASSTRTSTTPTRERKVFHGEKLSGGYALGKAFIYRDIFSRRLRTYSIRESDIPFEKKRIQNAIRSVRNELSEARDFIQNSMTDEDAEIFEVHRMILKDPRLLRDFETELVSERINAEQVVKNVFRKWIRRFESSESDRLSNRAEDLRDLNRKILCVLLGYEMNVLEKLPSNSIVIARRLLPSDTLNIRRKNLKGIITEEGSSLSHSAILARNLGIPAVSGLGRIEKIVTSKTRIMLDGTAGKVILNPRREEAAALRKKIAVLERRRTFCIRRASKESATRDGTKVNVFANAASAKDMQNAVDSGADGIGLFRTEQVYMSSNRMPGEDELFERFRSIMKPAGKRDVVVRLLDIGGDKRLPYIPMEEELSPFLGLRGIRILLKHENLLRTQIRVILKLRREFNVRLLIPMVTLPEEIKRVAAMIRECRDALNRRFRKKIPSLETGAMIETPAAVSSIYRFANQSDFFSIGTNDLIQYTMCAGRENASVSYYYDKGRAIMIRTIRKIVRAANKKKIGVSLCGELANDPAYTEKLLRTGLRTLSVFPHQIPEIKESIRQVRL